MKQQKVNRFTTAAQLVTANIPECGRRAYVVLMTPLEPRPGAPRRAFTLLAFAGILASACATDDGRTATFTTTSTSVANAAASDRWIVVPDAVADPADRALLGSMGRPLAQFVTATRPMADDAFYTRERCIELTEHTLPQVADDLDELLQLAAQLHNETFRDAVTMNMKVKNAALIVCSSGREVGSAGRDLIQTTNESIEAHLDRLGDFATPSSS